MLDWMAWTPPTAVFFLAIAAMLVVMGTLEAIYPTAARRGVLPMATTRGDRFFIGLLGSAYIHLAWLGLANGSSLWWATGISAAFVAAMLRWG